MNGKMRQIATLLFLLGTLFSIAAAQETGAVLRFTVLDEKDNFYPGLKSADIRVLRDKRPLEIVSFAPRSESSLEILILIDASISQERTLPDEKRAAEYFIDHVLKQGKDKVAVISFTGAISMRKDLTSDLDDAKKQLRKIEVEPPSGYVGGGVVPGTLPPSKDQVIAGSTPPSKDQVIAGSTSIWDSINKASEALAQVKSDAARAILVITDGQNTYGETKLKECIALSVRNRIPVYSIGIGDDFYDGVDKDTLKKLSGQTGGLSIIPAKKLEDLGGLIGKIGQALRSGYEVTLAPGSLDKPGILTVTTIEIVEPQLRNARLQIIQPKGVFSPK